MRALRLQITARMLLARKLTSARNGITRQAPRRQKLPRRCKTWPLSRCAAERGPAGSVNHSRHNRWKWKLAFFVLLLLLLQHNGRTQNRDTLCAFLVQLNRHSLCGRGAPKPTTVLLRQRCRGVEAFPQRQGGARRASSFKMQRVP
jgi:hypothetical protein